MACTVECCSSCCGIFSIIAIVFLVIMGIIIDKQTMFVHGIEEGGKSSKACFGGAGIYAGTLVLCAVAYVYDQNKKKRRQATAELLKEEQEYLTSKAPAGTYGDGTMGTELTRI